MRERIHKLKLNIKSNKGVSLTEMIIAFAILGFVAGCVMLILSAGSNMFTRVDNAINIQYKSQSAMTQFQEQFMPCSTAITQMDGNVIYFSDSQKVYALRFDAEDGKVYYGDSDIADAKTNLVADNITTPLVSDISEFSVTVNAASGNANSVKVFLTVSSGGKSYSTTQIFSFRNSPEYIKDPNEGSTYLNTLVDTITV